MIPFIKRNQFSTCLILTWPPFLINTTEAPGVFRQPGKQQAAYKKAEWHYFPSPIFIYPSVAHIHSVERKQTNIIATAETQRDTPPIIMESESHHGLQVSLTQSLQGWEKLRLQYACWNQQRQANCYEQNVQVIRCGQGFVSLMLGRSWRLWDKAIWQQPDRRGSVYVLLTPARFTFKRYDLFFHVEPLKHWASFRYLDFFF